MYFFFKRAVGLIGYGFGTFPPTPQCPGSTTEKTASRQVVVTVPVSRKKRRLMRLAKEETFENRGGK